MSSTCLEFNKSIVQLKLRDMSTFFTRIWNDRFINIAIYMSKQKREINSEKEYILLVAIDH